MRACVRACVRARACVCLIMFTSVCYVVCICRSMWHCGESVQDKCSGELNISGLFSGAAKYQNSSHIGFQDGHHIFFYITSYLT